MQNSASAPSMAQPEGADFQGKKKGKKYNIGQYKGLLTSIEDVKTNVEKERVQAKEKVQMMEDKLIARDKEASAIQKELSVQLRCAGRSYQQLLQATRDLTDQIRAEEDKRKSEVEVLEKQVKELKSQLGSAAGPWKAEVSKRDLKILKLQEAAADQDGRLREALAKVAPIEERAKAEVKAREEKIEILLNSMQLMRDEYEDKEKAWGYKFEDQAEQSHKEKLEQEVRIKEERDKIDDVHKGYAKQIKELQNHVGSLQDQLDEVDYTPYEKELRVKTAGYDKLVKDFKIKQQMNQDNIDRMRAGFEATLARMDHQLQDVEKEFERRLEPWTELVEKKEGEIVKLTNMIETMKEDERNRREKEDAEKEIFMKEYEAQKGAIVSLQQELHKVAAEAAALAESAEVNNPEKKLMRMQLQLDQVTQSCQAMMKKKDRELSEKTDFMKRLQQRIIDDANAAAEMDKEWDRRVQEKEDGYNRVCAQLKFAEGQIVEERQRVAHRDMIIKRREADIKRLQAEHDEELRFRAADRELLAREIRRLEELMEAEVSKHDDTVARTEKKLDDFKARSEIRLNDLKLEIDRRDRQKTQISKELQTVKGQFEHARLEWEEKEREYEIMIRGRDRLITNLKNEIEFMNDSWEIKYNRLAGLYEKVQKKYDETVGIGGVSEAFRRVKELKLVNQELKSEILELQEMIKKQKRNIRDLQLDLDMLKKETSDIIAEKEKGIAEMVGDMAKLESRYRAEVELKEALVREMTAEKIQLVESFQARIEQLEQLVESMRYTDRQDLVDTIDVWKRAYERVCIDRDESEEEYKELIDRKDEQLKKMAEDNAEVRSKIQDVKDEAAQVLEKEIDVWKKQEVKWKLAKQDVEKEVEELRIQIIQLKREIDKMLGSMGSASEKDEIEKEELRAKIKELEDQLAAVEAGRDNILREMMDMQEKAENMIVETSAAAEDWEPQIRWRDERYEAMVKEHEALKLILQMEMQKAQDTCKFLQEQIRCFPNPFEQELIELKDKYAQQEAGLMRISLDNMKLQESHKDYQEEKETEIQSLEDALKMASAILKEVASLGALSSMSKADIDDLEAALGIDLDGDGVVG